jgi:hypothetical protein
MIWSKNRFPLFGIMLKFREIWLVRGRYQAVSETIVNQPASMPNIPTHGTRRERQVVARHAFC